MSSRGRARIIKVLAFEGEVNISKLVKSTGLSYPTVCSHLAKLKEIGLVDEVSYGRVRIFRIRDRELATLIRQVITKLEKITSSET
ncbi:MAG: ArsR family transcriptional regulator [Thermoprotei archaeon]|nr:MAG: ArsR family transcriptional regulator [Thermoprotei archaeon]